MLDGLFRPRAVAVIAASANPYSIGHIVIKNLATYGYKGPIFPINPKGGHIRSFKAFRSVLDVPDEMVTSLLVVEGHALGQRAVGDAQHVGPAASTPQRDGVVHGLAGERLGQCRALDDQGRDGGDEFSAAAAAACGEDRKRQRDEGEGGPCGEG